MINFEEIVTLFTHDKELVNFYSNSRQIAEWLLQEKKVIATDNSKLSRAIRVLYFPFFRMAVWGDSVFTSNIEVLKDRRASSEEIQRAEIFNQHNISINSGEDYFNLFSPRILNRMKFEDFKDYIING